MRSQPTWRCIRPGVFAGLITAAALLLDTATLARAVQPPTPFGPLPTAQQLAWHEWEYYGFLHFTVNTFTDKEWGGGDERPEIFAPSELDVTQWTQIAQSVGMRGLILTAKHHDGFCLWPSKFTEHSIKNSPYQQGKGDLVGELATACRNSGLKFGLYLSPWDRNHPDYGRPAYLEYYRSQLRELLTQYGEVDELWLDGANGGSGFYGGANENRHIDRISYYQWPATHALAFELQPRLIIFSDAGPGCRWVGNESGQGASTNWATMRLEGMYPGGDYGTRLTTGDRDGTHWVPAEVDVSIRPGWFFHEQENDRVKTVQQLLDIYYSSIGQGCNLLLNVPPDPRGRIHEIDAQRLLDFHNVLQRTFDEDLARGKRATASNTRGDDPRFGPDKLTDGDRETYWAADDTTTQVDLVVEFGQSTPFDRVRIQECIALGQRIEEFFIDARIDGAWQELAAGTTIGVRRIMKLPATSAEAVRLRITSSRACPTISTLEVYQAP